MELSVEVKNNIRKQIGKVLEETTHFDFPFMAKPEKKKTIIAEKKLYIEEQLKKVAPERFPNEDTLKEIWDESVAYADEQFKSLSEKNKLNGFYLQELMHDYTEKIGDRISDNVWGGVDIWESIMKRK